MELRLEEFGRTNADCGIMLRMGFLEKLRERRETRLAKKNERTSQVNVQVWIGKPWDDGSERRAAPCPRNPAAQESEAGAGNLFSKGEDRG